MGEEPLYRQTLNAGCKDSRPHAWSMCAACRPRGVARDGKRQAQKHAAHMLQACGLGSSHRTLARGRRAVLAYSLSRCRSSTGSRFLALALSHTHKHTNTHTHRLSHTHTPYLARSLAGDLDPGASFAPPGSRLAGYAGGGRCFL